MMLVVLTVRRCPVRNCASAYVGIEEHCERCRDRIRVQREIAAGTRASRADINNHKRLSFRRRLGLLAEGENA